MKPAQHSCRYLADELRRYLGSGLTIDAATMHYIDSTFSNPTVSEIASILADEEDCERDPLIELLFSPDEAIQVRLEKHLEKSAFNRQDRALITDRLMRPPAAVKIRLPENRGPLEIQLPLAGAERLVSLLHIEKHLPVELQRAIDATVEKVHAARVRVVFRNARCRFCERDVTLLSSALAGLDLDRQSDIDSLEYALGVLADSPPPEDVYQVLTHRKKIYSRQLQTALKQQEQLRKSNPEIMMLQGKRIGGMDTAEARRLMAMIDRICLVVFNRTEPTVPPALEAVYDIHDGGGALKLFY